jgi:hypothetical protein
MTLANQLQHLRLYCLTAHLVGTPLLLLLRLQPLVRAVQQNLWRVHHWGESPAVQKRQCRCLLSLLQHQLTLAGQPALLLWGQQHLLL